MTIVRDARLLFLPDSDEHRFLPEGPTAIGIGRFSWVAIQHGADSRRGSLHVFDLHTGTDTCYELPGRPGFAKPTQNSGEFVIGCERELAVFRTADRSWHTLAGGVDADVSNTIINDGTCFGEHLLFGSKDLEFKTKKAGLYLFRGTDHRVIRLRDDQICSNGKFVIQTLDGLQLFDIDTPTRKVVRYRLDVSEGCIAEEQSVLDLSELAAFPDGMVVTPDQRSVIISFYNPNPVDFGETRQYSLENGSLEAIWRTPKSPQATCPLLVAHPDGTIKLIITTAVEHMSKSRQADASLAGGIFIAETDLRHAPPLNSFVCRVQKEPGN